MKKLAYQRNIHIDIFIQLVSSGFYNWHSFTGGLNQNIEFLRVFWWSTQQHEPFSDMRTGILWSSVFIFNKFLKKRHNIKKPIIIFWQLFFVSSHTLLRHNQNGYKHEFMNKKINCYKMQLTRDTSLNNDKQTPGDLWKLLALTQMTYGKSVKEQ